MALNEAQSALESGKAEFDRQISDALATATDAIDAARRNLDETIASAQRTLEDANKAVENFIQEQGQELESLQAELQEFTHSVLKTQVDNARALVEQLKNDKTASITVNTGLDLLGKLSNDQLDNLDSNLRTLTGNLITGNLITDLRLKLKGYIRAKAEKIDPFLITVSGKLGGTQDFKFELEWRPWEKGLDESSWFKRLGKALLGLARGDEAAVRAVRGVGKV